MRDGSGRLIPVGGLVVAAFSCGKVRPALAANSAVASRCPAHPWRARPGSPQPPPQKTLEARLCGGYRAPDPSGFHGSLVVGGPWGEGSV